MKSLINEWTTKTLLKLIFLVGLLVVCMSTTKPAEAYPGSFCTTSGGCSHCEACVTPGTTGVTGTCMHIVGCY